MNAVEVIRKKRDGHKLTREEIEYFVQGFQTNAIADYQMAAMLMAIYLKDCDNEETAQLTLAMANSGRMADWSHISGPKVDKHSTGGVGDKISIVLAPLCAACGIVVPMMSGRGLGHTGGTLDKLEAIPGLSTALTTPQFEEALSTIGCAIIGCTSDIAPVDKRMYALRDVTGTVESLPLLCSSIMCKKLAEGPEALVIDVKCGKGAFLKNWDESVALAQAMISAGENAGKPTVCVMTNMNQPLGNAVGNWLEIVECLDVLGGKGPADIVELCVQEAAHMLVLAKLCDTHAAAVAKATAALCDGTAMAKFRAMVAFMGGSLAALDDVAAYPAAKFSGEVVASAAGYVQGIEALEVGLTCVSLGAGRARVEDKLDYSAGILFSKKIGDAVAAGECICRIYTDREAALAPAIARITAAVTFGGDAPAPEMLIHGIVDKNGLKKY
jgi:pyrimidine-nucleoside phosphorylase